MQQDAEPPKAAASEEDEALAPPPSSEDTPTAGLSISFTMGQAGLGMASYLMFITLLCFTVTSDPVLTPKYSQLAPTIYVWPMVAFGTAFLLNALQLMFERESANSQLLLLACYINLAAGLDDYMTFRGWLPIVFDCWGMGLHLGRMIMWLHTTVPMVYMLSTISDYTKQQVYIAMAADVAMHVCGISASIALDRFSSTVLYVCAFSCYAFVIYSMWNMFSSALKEALDDSARLSLRIIQTLTVGLWFVFPITFVVSRLRLVSLDTEELLWTMGDLLGKVMFSSSLLQCNFLTSKHRQLVVMRVVEQGNKMQVVQERQELDEHKQLFLSGVSTELQAPLSGIIGIAEAILVGDCGDVNPKIGKAIETIKSNGSKLLAQITSILDSSHVKQVVNNKVPLRQEKIALHKVVEDVLEVCRPLAKRGVKLVNFLDNGMPPALGDNVAIVQILNSLVANACKYTETGHVLVGAQVRSGAIDVFVEDTGVGLTEQQRAALIGPPKDTPLTGKTGGLEMVQQLVMAHGGALTVKATRGGGSKFCFSLKLWEGSEAADALHAMLASARSSNTPVSPDTRPQAAVKAAAQEKRADIAQRIKTQPNAIHKARSAPRSVPSNVTMDTNSKTPEIFLPSSVGADVQVLSVDDDLVNQMVIQNLLGPAGYKIHQAMDGQEALDLLAELGRLPDIILLDVMMPGMSGYEVCSKLRELYPESCVPIIMVSAKSKEEDIVQGLAAGANDYVVKPFGRTEILARIATHLNFTDKTFHAGKEAASKKEMAASALTPFLSLHTQSPSLPPAIKAELAASQTMSTQLFNQVTIVAWQIVNLSDLCAQVPMVALATALAGFHKEVDALLERWNLYMPDQQEQDHSLAVAGLEAEVEHIDNALGFASALLNLPAKVQLPDDHSVLLRAAIHTMPAQGVVVGLEHPVMRFTGQVVHVCGQLLASCTPGCAHASHKVFVAVGTNADACFEEAGKLGNEPTYLLKAGNAWKDSIEAVAAASKAIAADPNAIIRTDAQRFGPLKRALADVNRTDPAVIIELAQEDANDKKSSQAAEKQIEALQHDKELLERQLQEVTDETTRLQHEVEQLHNQVLKSDQSKDALDQEGEYMAHRVHELMCQLRDKNEEVASLKVKLAEVEAEHIGQLQSIRTQADSGLPLNKVGSVSMPLVAGGMRGPAAPSGLSSAGSSVVPSPGTVSASVNAEAAADIGVFLTELGLAELAPRFLEEQVTPQLVPLLDDATLKDMGVTSMGARLKVRLAAQELFGTPDAPRV